MPILIPQEATEPLSQGDLLGDVRIYCTAPGLDHPPGAWNHDLALVLSRPCVAVNKPRVVVAAVEPAALQLPRDLKAQSLADLVSIMAEVRDADGSDAFYLGEIPGQGSARYKARLDFVATMEVPTASAARASWTDARRKATLHPDFRRDIHTRLFLSIAKQGFEDIGWFSDQDLKMLVDFAHPKVTAARQAVEEATAAISQAQATNTYTSKRIGLDKSLADAQAAYKKLSDELKPYEDELKRRGG